MMLCKHADSQTIMQEAITILELKLAHQSFDQGRFTGTIRSDQGNSCIQINVDVNAIQYSIPCSIADSGLIQATKRRRNLLRIREHKDTGRVLNNLSDDIDTLNSLDS